MRPYHFLFVLLLLAVANSQAQWESRHGLSPAQYQAFATESANKGLRPISVSGYTDGGAERYAAIYGKKGGPEWVTKHGLSAAEYQTQINALAAQGYVISFISGYEVGGQVKYAGIWEKKNTNYIARHGQNGTQFQAEFDANTKNGYRLVFLTSYESGNTANYASIYQKSPGPLYYAHAGLDADAYQQVYSEHIKEGFRLVVVSGCNVGGKDYYSGIWEKSASPLAFAKHGIKANNYQNVSDNFYYQGYKPVFITAFASSGTERFNGIWENTNMSGADIEKIDDAVKGYMSTQNVKAMSLAVCKDDRLVFAKGYGDANPSTGQDMSPSYSLRIMSISKPITSTGIMRLVANGSLNLDRKVFGPGSIFGSKYAYPQSNKSNLEKITVRMLLHHVSGLRTCNGETPFWTSTSAYSDCMSVLLNDTKLFKFAPNTQANYANTNFFILARIIEQVSGQNYEAFIRTNVLTPSGVGNSMYVGATDGKPGNNEPSGYTPMNNMNLKMWDGFGGWVARPIDLLKVLVRFDGLKQKPDLISAALQDTMTTTTSMSNGYALGWIADSKKQTHNGCFGGTRSFLYYDIPTGLSFAVIINDDPTNDACGWTMQSTILGAIQKVSKWPGYDLF
ncbi:MAG: serine hydrolase [Chitinophagaceae bacterium]